MESSVALQQVKWVKSGRDAGWWPGVLTLVTPCFPLRSQYPTLHHRLQYSNSTTNLLCEQRSRTLRGISHDIRNAQ